MFENKKIFILGLARSGYEAAKVLAKRNNQIIVNDMNLDQDQDKIKELKDLGVNVILGSHLDDILTSDFDYLIKNPGIRNDHKYVLYCNKFNIPVINEIEMAYHLLPKNVSIIGITGTNGKTTTTTLIYEVLRRGNRNVHLTGNLGFPLSSFLGKIKEDDIIVIEIAGHHLVNFKDFKTNVSVLTNISEAHLDFHGSYNNYINIKNKIFDHHTNGDLAIINYDNSDSMKLFPSIKSRKVYFSSKEKCSGAYLLDNYIYINNEKFLNVNDTRLKGNHNYENMMCAIICGIEMNIDKEQIKDAIIDFGGVEHRLEFVRKINNIEFYNDSKSTNNKATQIALSAFSNPIILILGGLDRGQNFDELSSYMNHVKKIVCYGETKNKIKEFSIKNNIECIVLNNLEQATKLSYQLAESGMTVLLSPACASWDQYKCFEDRGNEYKAIINNFK